MKQLETYLGLTRWQCNYILYYTGITKLLQDWKTKLLSQVPKNRNLC